MTDRIGGIERSLRNHMSATIATSLALVVGLGGWAATTELAGAVIAAGQVVVDSNLKKVQHPTGGIVKELLVRDGTHVRAGDTVIRLDDTQTRSSLAIVTKAIDELVVRQAREEAERDGMADFPLPGSITSRLSDEEVMKLVVGERLQFKNRGEARDGEKKQLAERISQLTEEINGYSSQIVSKKKQIEWIAKELEGVNELWAKNLVPYTRVTSLEREKERLDGEIGQLVATIALTKGRITETQLQIMQVDQQMRTEVTKDLADIRSKMSELLEKRIAADDLLKRIDLRAPQDGYVHQMSVHTVGGVIGAGETVMLIVPRSDPLDIEARIAPQDIDQIHVGQTARLRFTSFNQRTTPEIFGEVKLVSPDASEDQKTGAHFYTVRISIDESGLSQLGELVPGMPVDVFVHTHARTVMSYLMRPLRDQIFRAFRED